MNIRKYDYTVIEDNGGGLHLFLFRPGTEELVSAYTGFEYAPGSLLASLASLNDGDDAKRWDGKMDDAQEVWDYLREHDYSHKVIAYSDGQAYAINPDHMGAAGRIEFGIKNK